MADAVEVASQQLPAWLLAYVPTNGRELDTMAAQWLREHARDCSRWARWWAHPGPHHHRPGDRRMIAVSDLTNRGAAAAR